jgi:hypothetical protein
VHITPNAGWPASSRRFSVFSRTTPSGRATLRK